ncbi:MAG: hypothetical protein MPW14_08740 [Candidatus Manganitrophus sp.]|nr:MAG: hypothetical protein MPW14_08740 [Candidatus Manganitrophus sp.]
MGYATVGEPRSYRILPILHVDHELQNGIDRTPRFMEKSTAPEIWGGIHQTSVGRGHKKRNV